MLWEEANPDSRFIADFGTKNWATSADLPLKETESLYLRNFLLLCFFFFVPPAHISNIK